MKIINPQEIKKKSYQINGGIAFIARDSEIITMSNEPILKTMEDIEPPNLDYLDVEVYFLPQVYRQYGKGMFNEVSIIARAGMGWVAISPLIPSWLNLNYEYVMWHELGHVFHVQKLGFFQRTGMSPEFEKYRELRGIQNWGWGSEYPHEYRAEEVFADDFAYLIGGVSEVNRHGDLPLPNREVEEYIRNFIRESGGDSVNFKDIKGHWAEFDILAWAQKGIVQGSEGKFRPDDSITRAEMMRILSNLVEAGYLKA